MYLFAVGMRDGHRRGEFSGRTDPQPALVLLDLKLPKVDGLEVLRQVRAFKPVEPSPQEQAMQKRIDELSQ